jgi:ferritin
LSGFATFFRVQAQEEGDHAMKIFSYIIQVGGRVALGQIDAPQEDFVSPEEVFRLAYGHEQYVTKSIYELVDIAVEEKDHKTTAFLQWFVTEQAEEEASMDSVLRKLKLIGNDGRGLLMIDAELAQRVYTPPTPAQA